MKNNLVSALSVLLLLFSALPLHAQEEDQALASESAPAEAVVEEPIEVKEKKYVTDKLRLSLYKQSNDRSGTLKLLVSGDVLGILERKGPYSRVRTTDGVIGWVKNGFLVDTPTASYQLIEEEKKNKILSEQLEQYGDTQKLVDDYEDTISKINADLEALQSTNEETQNQLQQATDENLSLKEQIEASQQGQLTTNDILFLLKSYWYVIVGLVLALVIAGFVLGKVMIENQVKRHFQGVKVW
jgi:SH3 domain protein